MSDFPKPISFKEDVLTLENVLKTFNLQEVLN